MQTSEIFDLIQALNNSEFRLFELNHEGTKLTLSKDARQQTQVEAQTFSNRVDNGSQMSSPMSSTASAIDSTVKAEIKAEVVNKVVVNDDSCVVIKSPIVGTFYSASGPDTGPYVKKGDCIKKGDILCIVEAMKLMNEIDCEYDGEIVEILVENEAVVEFGQPLFKIKRK